MRPNTARQRLEAGRPILGATVSCTSPLVAETMGHLGYDWVLLDLQHGENNLGNLATLLTAVSATPTVPWVRVVSNDGPMIQRVLDLGAYGVVVPLVNNAREAEAAVRAMRYPPKGDRSGRHLGSEHPQPGTPQTTGLAGARTVRRRAPRPGRRLRSFRSDPWRGPFHPVGSTGRPVGHGRVGRASGRSTLPSMSWELWAIPSGNLITATETEAEALDVARGLLLTDWRADELSLIFEDESKPIEDLPPALTGDALARRAAVPSSARRISA